jgi:hypothetical protein
MSTSQLPMYYAKSLANGGLPTRYQSHPNPTAAYSLNRKELKL